MSEQAAACTQPQPYSSPQSKVARPDLWALSCVCSAASDHDACSSCAPVPLVVAEVNAWVGAGGAKGAAGGAGGGEAAGEGGAAAGACDRDQQSVYVLNSRNIPAPCTAPSALDAAVSMGLPKFAPKR